MFPQHTALTRHRRSHLAKLLDAARTCKLVPLKRYLSAGGTANAIVDINLKNDIRTYRVPLLHSAVIFHHYSAEYRGSAELLLNAGAEVDAVDYNLGGCDRTALLWAAVRSCCDDQVKLLLQRGADPCWQSIADGTTALHAAAAHGELTKCELLLASNGRALHLRNKLGGRLPVWDAVGGGHVAVVDLLRQHGADLHAVDSDGATLLHNAVGADTGIAHPEMLKHLLNKGLDPNALWGTAATPLHLALIRRSTEAAHVLLEHGADPSITNAAGFNALHTTARYPEQFLSVMECILDNGGGSKVDVNALTQEHSTALHISLLESGDRSSSSVAAMQLLLDHGTDPRIYDKEGFNALHLTAREPEQRVAAMACLLRSGKVDVNAATSTRAQSTALHIAIGSSRASTAAVQCSCCLTMAQIRCAKISKQAL
jgi:ankyrin repeat protein